MIQISDYQYELPQNLIAQKPASPRDRSRLFVYDTKTDTVVFDRFIHLDRYLPGNSLLVLNNTKVLPSRITLYKESEGKVRVLFLVNEFVHAKTNIIQGMVDRHARIGERLYFDKTHFCTAISQDTHLFSFKLQFPREKLFSLLQNKGTMPIPLYIKHSPLTEHELRQKYQTIFAKEKGSSAAPTASLHFTNRVFNKLEKKEIEKCFVTLHVGLGTFAPVDEENIRSKTLYKEYYEIPDRTLQHINTSKCEGKKVVSVGTTVTRTLESFAKSKVPTSPPVGGFEGRGKNQKAKLMDKTDLFIFPPYEFKIVDHLITNFHLPESSLMMLVEAFLRYKKSQKSLIHLYSIAIQNHFRFYSFGDAMLIL